MKKLLIATAVALALPFAAVAQSADTAKPAAKAAAKPAAKPTAAAAAKPAAKAGETPPKRQRQVTRRAAKAVEEVTPITDDVNVTLTDTDLEVAKRVHVGKIQCELGADVTVTADDKKPGFFTVSTKGARYRMHPVESRTGAIRLEDPAQGAMWLQIANKSMLMNQKMGLRLADECMAPEQVVAAEALKKNPPKSLFDAPDAPNAPTTAAAPDAKK